MNDVANRFGIIEYMPEISGYKNKILEKEYTQDREETIDKLIKNIKILKQDKIELLSTIDKLQQEVDKIHSRYEILDI